MPDARLNIVPPAEMNHRSGWAYAMRALAPLHNPDGVLFDGFTERKFGWGQVLSWWGLARKVDADAASAPDVEKVDLAPYSQPWVGVTHFPPNIPKLPFASYVTPERIFEKDAWRESIVHCRGLFSLSQYHADWLQERLHVPVAPLIHPTEIPERRFDAEAFVAQERPAVVQVGWWLRRVHSIYELPVRTYRRVWPKPFAFSEALLKLERGLAGYRGDYSGVETPDFLSNEDYDDLLSQSVVFVHLYDASANNAVIECIARATPILVNPLPAVREYLGDDYPLYFETLDEAARKVEDRSLVLRAHEYLRQSAMLPKLSADYFCRSVAESSIYESL
jgi:hypothetical protein